MSAVFYILLISLSVTLLNSCNSTVPVVLDSHVEVVKGKSDPAHYRYVQLDNGLKLLLVSDPKLVKAYGSLSVKAGYFQDPKNMAGLAHLYEHMLSKGSSKYPNTAEYKQFLADHGGRSNASTSALSTNYYFQVANSGFEMALDRFAWQFIDPLLFKDVAYRERHAVDAEFNLKFRDAFRRKREAFRQLINPAHPYSQFSTGNLSTLQDTQSLSLPQALVDFGNDYYCASRMGAVLAAPLSLDELNELGQDVFSAVSSNCKQPLEASANAFISSDFDKVLNIKTLKKRSRLNLSFVVPNTLDTRNSLSSDYIEWLFESAGQGSLLEYLKEQGLVKELYASSSTLDERHQLFNLEFRLSNKGWLNNGPILAATFDYIDFISQNAINSEAFEPFQLMKSAKFNRDSQHKSANDIRHLATQLIFEPAAHVLSGGRVASKFSSSATQSWLTYLNKNNMQVIKENRQLSTSQIEPIYQTEYGIGESLTWQKNTPVITFKLPKGSPYFVEEPLAVAFQKIKPGILLQQPGLTVRFLPSAVSNDNYTAITIYLDTNLKVVDEDFDYLNPLFDRRLKIQLEPVIDSAKQAGIDVSIGTTRHGVKLAISGRGGNWIKLMDDLLSIVAQPKLNEKQLTDSLKTHIRSIQSLSKARLSTQSQQLLDSRLGLAIQAKDSLAYFDSFDEKRYQQFSARYLNSAHLSGFYYGYLQQNEWQAINSSLQLLATKVNQPKLAVIDRWEPWNMSPIQTHRVLLADADSAVRLLLLSKDQSLISFANTELLGAMIKASFFHQLRTQEQLGYSVSAGAKVRYGHPMLSYYVQSPVAVSEQLLERIQQFNKWYLAYLTSMPEEQFEQVKQTLATALQLPQINSASAEAQLRYNFRKGRNIDFEQQLQKTIRSMSQADFLRFAVELLNQPLQGVLVDSISKHVKR
jgi:secreted Zn-dependent insulinase-like peptidase